MVYRKTAHTHSALSIRAENNPFHRRWVINYHWIEMTFCPKKRPWCIMTNRVTVEERPNPGTVTHPDNRRRVTSFWTHRYHASIRSPWMGLFSGKHVTLSHCIAAGKCMFQRAVADMSTINRTLWQQVISLYQCLIYLAFTSTLNRLQWTDDKHRVDMAQYYQKKIPNVFH